MTAYVSRGAWKAAAWRGPVYPVSPAQRTHFLVHYHGGPPNHDRGAAMAREVESIHINNGWVGTGYNFMVGQDGVAYEGRGWSLIGAHCPGMNTRGIGVYVAVGGNQKPTMAALRKVRELYEETVRRAGHSITPSFHGAHYPTECAGHFLNTWVKGGMSVTGTPGRVPKPPRKPVLPTGKGKIKVDGILGTKTYAALQRRVGVKADGLWGPATRRGLQTFLRVAADGIVGPATIRALQNAVGVDPDGIWGTRTTRALQRRLNAGTLRRPNAHKGGPRLTVDGIRGPDTVRALQRAVGASVDGFWGPRTVKALQSHLRVAADGSLGPKTIKALQRRVDVRADGKWGPNTTMALQRALNAGRL